MKPIGQAIRIAPRIGAVTRARVHGGTLRELYQSMIDSGRWWLIPMVGILGLSALLLVAVTAIEYVAPFVYTVF